MIMPNTCRCYEPHLASVQASAVHLRVLKAVAFASGGKGRSAARRLAPEVKPFGRQRD